MNIAVVQKEQARYYNPSTGRWLSEDIIGFQGGDANFYRYVKSNPIGNKDPHGKTTVNPIVAIGAIFMSMMILDQCSNSDNDSKSKNPTPPKPDKSKRCDNLEAAFEAGNCNWESSPVCRSLSKKIASECD